MPFNTGLMFTLNSNSIFIDHGRLKPDVRKWFVLESRIIRIVPFQPLSNDT